MGSEGVRSQAVRSEISDFGFEIGFVQFRNFPHSVSNSPHLNVSLQRFRTRAAGALPNTDASPCPQQYNCATFSFPFSIRWLPLDSKTSLRNAVKTKTK
jgi:hypothetical protein